MNGLPRERMLGFGMLGAAAVCLIIALVLALGGYRRWSAVGALQDYRLAVLGGDAEAAAGFAREAAAKAPDDAALVLPSLDLMEGDTTPLERLRNRVPARQRPVVDTALAFQGALHGKQAGEVEGSDAKLVAHLIALSKGELPPFPDLVQGSAPHAAILDRAAQAQVRAAWIAGDAKALASGLSPLLLLRPDHAEAARMRVLLAAAGEGPGGVAAAFVHDIGAGRTAFLRKVAILCPEDATALLRLIPEGERTPAEIQRMLLAAGQQGDLKQQVEQALKNPGDAVLTALFRRCLSEGDLGLAAQITEKAGDTVKPSMELALAVASGDLGKVAQLQPKRTDLKPRVTRLLGKQNTITFHLATASGFIPRGSTFDVRINGDRIPPERIKRWGSLVQVEFRGGGVTAEVQVLLGETVVHTGPVKL